MSYYVGIDLHSNNNFVGIIDKKDCRILSKKLPNDLGIVLNTLKPFKRQIKGVVVESTYNWYWLVDGLMDNKYKVHLANPSQIQQYSGMKYTDDKWDSFWLAHMLRLEILPEGYIYPKDIRPIRDLLRKRMMLVQHSTTNQNTISSGIKIYYPFHPFYGLELEVIGKFQCKDDTVTVKAPDGSGKRVPIWITQPEAAYYRISKYPIINLKAILNLVELLECCIEDLKF
jgi:hypothetical protein